MPDYVRAEVNGQHVTTTRAHAKNANLKIVDEEPLDRNGRPRSATKVDGRIPKPRTTVKKQAAKKSTAKRAAKKSTSGGSTASTPRSNQ